MAAYSKLENDSQKEELFGDYTAGVNGMCMDMCPQDEREMRIREDLVHNLERIHTNDGYDRLVLVKSFSRSAAGRTDPRPCDLRPAPALLDTVHYLLHEVITRTDTNFANIYDFIFDRLRAIRQDITIQRLVGLPAIVVYEQIIAFYLYSAYRLCEEPITMYDDKINQQHTIECLKLLLTLYKNREENEEQRPIPHNIVYSVNQKSVDQMGSQNYSESSRLNSRSCNPDTFHSDSAVEFDDRLHENRNLTGNFHTYDSCSFSNVNSSLRLDRHKHSKTSQPTKQLKTTEISNWNCGFCMQYECTCFTDTNTTTESTKCTIESLNAKTKSTEYFTRESFNRDTNCEMSDLASKMRSVTLTSPNGQVSLYKSIYILYNMGDETTLAYYLGLPLKERYHPTLRLAYKISLAYLHNNYVRTLRLIWRLRQPLCRLAAFHSISKLQRSALTVMSVAFRSKNLAFPVQKLTELLAFDDIYQCEDACTKLGLNVKYAGVLSVAFDKIAPTCPVELKHLRIVDFNDDFTMLV